VEQRLFNILDALRTEHVIVYGGVETMVYIDRKLALNTLLSAAYVPYTNMAPLFEALSDLEKGDGLKLYHIFGNLTVTCQDCQPLTVAHAGATPEAGIAIQCADSGPISDDLSFVGSISDALSARTLFADIVYTFSTLCV
jgi:hypothetical protein